MSKVHPQVLVSPTSSKQDVFTLWMKSLIFSSNGCVVFDSNGKIIYRVDNYDHKCRNQVYIMDVMGKILFTIVKKKFYVLGMWDGYSLTKTPINKEKPRFQVRKIMGIGTILRFFSGCSIYKAVIGLDQHERCEYVMENERNSKSLCYKIFDSFGVLVAEVKRKITTSGVALGEDVLTMVVEPHIDHSLIMGLVVVFGLINHKL